MNSSFASFALLALLLATPAVQAATEEELLEPDQAFALSTRVIDARTLEARWTIAPGYYLYRDKFKFESLEDSIVLKTPLLPPGKKKDDPFFGTVEIYTNSVTVRLPLERRHPAAHRARMKITAQGCNEPIGVCYPPIVKEIAFELPSLTEATPAAPRAASRPKEIASLEDLARVVDPKAASAGAEVVDPDKAFHIQLEPLDAESLRARIEIADCCYLYRERTRVELIEAPAGLRLGPVTLPPGKIKVDEFIGKTEVYTQTIELRLPVEGAAAGPFTLAIHYQGCSEKGVAICYPPMSKSFRVSQDAAAATWRIAPLSGTTLVEAGGARSGAEDEARDWGKFLLAVLAAFGTGLLLTFTPCVLPMIPILSSMIVSTGDRHITKLEGGLLSLAYVLGTAVTYTVAGVIAGLSGEQLQAYFQTPWALGFAAALFVLLALSMFGFYELQVPASVQSFLHQKAQSVHSRTRQSAGPLRYLGLFVVGLLSALIIGACVSPLFISALGIAIANRDPLLGGAIMFSMALGMGVILIAIGVGAGFLLPKAGPWMNTVKHVFGVLLLAVAIYLLGLIPEVPVLYLWGALFIVTGVYLGATQSLPPGASGWRYLWKGLGTLLFIWGLFALAGGMAGHRDIFNPLPLTLRGGGVEVGGVAATKAEPLFERVKTLGELEARLAQARAAGRPVLLDYYADWCTDCLRMEKATFADQGVRAELARRGFVLLQADVTDPNDPEVKAIKRRFGVYGPPAMLFFARNGEERRALRAYGFRSKAEFLSLIEKVD
jgi:thiol:disulfide interchange protein DsbD